MTINIILPPILEALLNSLLKHEPSPTVAKTKQSDPAGVARFAAAIGVQQRKVDPYNDLKLFIERHPKMPAMDVLNMYAMSRMNEGVNAEPVRVPQKKRKAGKRRGYTKKASASRKASILRTSARMFDKRADEMGGRRK